MLAGCPRAALAAAVSLIENERCGQRRDASMCDWFGFGHVIPMSGRSRACSIVTLRPRWPASA